MNFDATGGTTAALFAPLLGAENVTPNPAMILPFGLLLLAIAVMPFVRPSWWQVNYARVSVGLGLVTTVYYVFGLRHGIRMAHVVQEYVSFIALVGSLFVVSGGIHIRVKGEATPWVNGLFLLIGAVLANLVGTTGASMLLIRPWIRMNKYRITTFHVVFFIFVVSNVGGALTPIGDPPLFLGYLKGVPFEWTVRHCFLPWLVAVGCLIVIFLILDWRNFLRAPKAVREAETSEEVWRFDGVKNLLLLAVILGSVFIQKPAGLRELIMAAAAFVSYRFTPRSIHEANDFNFHPIKEVAWLFAGIFATMVPALDYLEQNAASLGLNSPAKFYWFAGSLSSFLDNAPTYLTFLAAGLGQLKLSLDDPAAVGSFAANHVAQLLGISLGAVFFGAMTYIGNGPNFMVKAIADQAKVHTPSFFGYLFKFAIPFLLPILALVQWLFLSS